MATPMELSELERGDGAWENIQEVLRFGFRNLWKAFAGVDSRVMELETSLTTQKDDSKRLQQHLEAIARTLNSMSEQLRLGQDEATNQRVEDRLQNLEHQLHDQVAKDRSSVVEDIATSKVSITKVGRRLDLLEEEMGHVVSAIDQKADLEALTEQGRTLHESIRKRCKKEAFDQEVLGLQNRLQMQREEVEKQLSVSFMNFKTTQETILQSEVASWAAKTQENVVKSVESMIDQATQRQTDTTRVMNDQIEHCYEVLTSRQKQMDELQGDIEKQIRLAIAADREDIARQCSEAHGRMNYQFRTQEECLERIRGEQRALQNEIAAAGNKQAEQTATEIAAAAETLDRRVLDREQQELEKMHRQLTEEVRLTVENALNVMGSAKDKEQRRLRQQQHLVARKLAELDQMMQLIGRQLIQNTSQLQVVRNEQLVQNFQLDMQTEEPDDDNELLVQYDNIAFGTSLAEVSSAPIVSGLPQAGRIEDRNIEQSADTTHENTAELEARRSQHQELQEQLDKKLRDYSQILDSNQQRERGDVETPTEPPPPPKEQVRSLH